MEPGLFTPVFTGLLVGLGLIVAIGAQNAFVLRQGLLREHVVPVILVCALSDVILIAAGVLGLGTLISQSPVLIRIATWGGAGFLLVYAGLALRRAMAPESLRPAANEGIRCAPSSSPRCCSPGSIRMSISTRWFSSARCRQATTALGASPSGVAVRWRRSRGSRCSVAARGSSRRCSPRPVSWRILDLAIAAVMVAIAISLLWGAAA